MKTSVISLIYHSKQILELSFSRSSFCENYFDSQVMSVRKKKVEHPSQTLKF